MNDAIAAFQRGELDRARELAQQQLEEQPGSPQLQHLLGLIDCRAGRLESGIEWLRRASDAEPHNAAFRVMLVRALVDGGRGADALAAADRPQGTSPADLALWHARAEAADAAGDHTSAAEAWQVMASARPNDWRAWSNLGNALAARQSWAEAAAALSRAASLSPGEPGLRRNAGSAHARAGNLEEALGHLQAAAAAAPGDAETHLMLAQALGALQRHDEAIAEFETAKRLDGESVAIEVGLGRRHLALSRYAEAEAALRRAYAIDPSDRAVVHQLGLVLERTNQLDELGQLLEEASAAGLGKDQLSYLWAVLARREGRLDEARELLLQSDPSEDPVAWNALMAKIADAMGDTAKAFDAAVAMNRAAKAASAKVVDLAEWDREAAAYRDAQHQLARTIAPQWGAAVPVLTDPPPRKVAFLLGFPRSGTTLLDTFLLGHPQIQVLEEVQLVGAAAEVTGPIAELPNVTTDVLQAARATFFNALAEHVGDFDGLIIVKNPLDLTSAPLIHAMLPGAPIIFAQRHPCDVVLSAFMQSMGLVNFSSIEDAADYYDGVMSIWTASREALPLNVHDVVYEELVRDPEATLRPVLGFLGLDWTDRLLDHQATAKARGTIVTPSYDQVTEPVTTRSVERWRRYRRQLEPVLPVLLPWAERLGYSGLSGRK